jgi:hypothetical protein
MGQEGTVYVLPHGFYLDQYSWPVQVFFFQDEGDIARNVDLQPGGAVRGQFCVLQDVENPHPHVSIGPGRCINWILDPMADHGHFQ